MRMLRSGVFAALVAGAAVFAMPALARAQTWLPARGQGSISLSYEYLYVKQHLFTGGIAMDLGHIYAQTVTASVDYGLFNRFAVSAYLPFIRSQYTGTMAEGPQDDGIYHGGLQDVTMHVRYMALMRPITLTPQLALVVPTNDYPTLGHVSIGAHLVEFHAGMNAGLTLRPFLPDAYVAGYGGYSWSETIDDMQLRREMANAEVGYFLSPRLSVHAFGEYAHTLGGVDWITMSGMAMFMLHDRFSAVMYRRAGGGLSLSLGPVDLYANIGTVISGANTHKGTGYSLGTSWAFHGIHVPFASGHARG